MGKMVDEGIEEYISNNEYEKIYREYGTEKFIKYVSKEYKSEEIKRLLETKNFDLIYKKYGRREYNKYTKLRINSEIIYELGKENKFELKRIYKPYLKKTKMNCAVILTSILFCLPPVSFGVLQKSQQFESYIKYYNEINDYNNKTDVYVDEMKKIIEEYQLSDLEVFMKVMDDMWNYIYRYENPKIDAAGYLRLDITKDGVGVCRNMADDMAYILNEINPKYNARCYGVYIEPNYPYYISSNIDTKKNNHIIHDVNDEVENSENIVEVVPVETTSEYADSLNHSVVLVNVDDSWLILDPTNALMGVVKDNKNYIINVPDGKECLYAYNFYNNMILDVSASFKNDMILKSNTSNDKSIEEITVNYGVEMQNRALNKIRSNDRISMVKRK